MDTGIMRTIVIGIVTSVLCSCSTGVSVATSGAQAVYNRQHLKETLNDHYITMQAYRKMYKDTDRYENTSVAIDTYHGEVLLTGQVPEKEEKQKITELVRSIDGVRKVYNLTEVTTPTSTLTEVSDSVITTKIKAKLLAAEDINPDEIKVVTENGTVFLMGILPKNQADTAIQIARTTEGVQNVVKLFSYLRISKS